MADSNLPLVTIGILSFNRRDDLRLTLDVVTRAIQYPSFEVLVIDNSSSDGSLEMMREEFPTVRVFEVGSNLGMPARNFQTKLARGKYLFSYDDDSYPGTPAMILRMVQFMEAHENIAALSGTCYRPITDYEETGEWPWYRHRVLNVNQFAGIFLVEGGVCFRLDSLRKVDGYGAAFVRGKDGMDLGLQLFKADLTMCLCLSFLTLHLASNLHRSNKATRYYEGRHTIWCIAKHWPIVWTPPLAFLWFIRRLLAFFIHPMTGLAGLKGIFDGIKGVWPYIRYRPKLTWRQAFKLGRYYFYIFRW